MHLLEEGHSIWFDHVERYQRIDCWSDSEKAADNVDNVASIDMEILRKYNDLLRKNNENYG